MLVKVLEDLSVHADEWTSNNVLDDFKAQAWQSLKVGAQHPRQTTPVLLAEK